ncbi:MAG: hypothetical protein ACI8VW_000091 [bacterium]|jgi:hypothetical protein
MSEYLGILMVVILLLTAVITVTCMLKKPASKLKDTDLLPTDDRQLFSSADHQKNQQTQTAQNHNHAHRKAQVPTKHSDTAN